MAFTPFSFDGFRFDRKALEDYLSWGAELGASDIVLRSDHPLTVRLHGEYFQASRHRPSSNELFELLDDIYMKSASATLRGGKPLDFRFEVRLDRTRRLAFRGNATSVHPYNGVGVGAAIVFRTIPDVPPSVEDLKLESHLLDHAFPGTGMVIVTGPTGSGKSTLLAALLRQVLETPPGRHVLTYEAPIEFNLGRIENMAGLVAQSEIPKHIESFSRGVENALRRAPDVILVGEMRDSETIEGGVTAAQTGHVVYSTLHTYGVVSALWRMADMYPLGYRESAASKILDSFRLLVHQRLVPRKGGGRLALIETLPFTEQIREELQEVVKDPSAFFSAARIRLREVGHPLERDLEIKSDLVDPRYLDKIAREIKRDER